MDHFTEWTFEGDLNNIHEAYRAMYSVRIALRRIRNMSHIATRRRRRISQARFFLYLQTKPQYMILITFKTDFFQKNILKIWRKK